MAYVDFETTFENALVAALRTGNTTYQVERFYDDASNEAMYDFLLSKVKTVPAIFVRSEGFDTTNLDTIAQVLDATCRIEIIVAYPDAGKMKQISAQARGVNVIVGDVLQKIPNANLGDYYVTVRGVRNLFMNERLDVRVISLQVEGVVIELS